jgi:hypothetical protein
MSTPPSQPGDEPVDPLDEADLGAAPPFDPDATPEILPNPAEQYMEGMRQHLRTAATATAHHEYGQARAALQEAIAARTAADAALTPERAGELLPEVESLLEMLAAIAVFERIDAVRDASILNLAEGWPLWSDIGTRIPALEGVLPDIARLTTIVSGWADAMRMRREALYKELRERRPATYGDPLLDPPHLRQ